MDEGAARAPRQTGGEALAKPMNPLPLLCDSCPRRGAPSAPPRFRLAGRRQAAAGGAIGRHGNDPHDLLRQRARARHLHHDVRRARCPAQAGGRKARCSGPTVSRVSLEPGASAAAVTKLRARLAVTEDLPPELAESDQYDQMLTEAVKRFQARHGLPETGNVGPQTVEALNVPVGKRIK